MTLEQFQEITESLSKWREARGLTIDGQRQGLLTNLIEEFREFVFAKDDFEKVDALCDCAVLLINAESHNLRSDPNWKHISLKIDPESAWMKIKEIGFDPYIAMQETIKELNSRKGKFDSSINKFVKSLGAYTFDEAQQKAKGAKFINEDNESWVFDGWQFMDIDDDLVIYKWYKADYEKARVN